jgi:putative SOS response-associated peptidase YedK
MCGRFALTVDPAELGDEFAGFGFPSQFAPRFNIAPSQPVMSVLNDGNNVASFLLWGLIPSWAKDVSIGSRLINARGETLAEKPSFRGPYKYRRCLILADGFFEWKSKPGTKSKIPHFIRLKSHRPFAFAGLWSEWQNADGASLRSCAVVTTGPNELMAEIHNRMPVILPPVDYAEWLDPAPRPPETLDRLIKPFPAALMQTYPVSTVVNNPSNDRAECILPA